MIFAHIHYLFKQIFSSSVSHNYCQWKSECHCYLFLLKVLHHESLVNKKTYHCCVGMSQIYPNLDHFFTHLDLLGQVRTIFRLIDPTCSDCTVEADDIWTSRIGTLTKAWRSILTTKTWEKIKGWKQSRSKSGQFHMIGQKPVHDMYNSTIDDSVTIIMNQSILKYDYSIRLSVHVHTYLNLFAWKTIEK